MTDKPRRVSTADPEIFEAIKSLDEAYKAKFEKQALRIKELEAALKLANENANS